MVILKDHALMIQNLYRKGEVDVSSYSDAQRETLWQLELAGLVRLAGIDEYELTFAGNMLAEIMENLIEAGKLPKPEEWEDSFRWVGSEVISMIRYSRQAQGRVKGKVAEELTKRGFAEDGKLTPEAEALSDVYDASHPRLVITKELAEYIKDMPPGPGERGRLPVGGDKLLELESMRLIAFSVPTSDIYALTGLGQQIRMALKKGAATFMDVVIDESILELIARAMRGDMLSESEKEILMIRGFMGMSEEILPAGEHLYLAYKIYRKGVYKKIPTFHVDDLEIKLMDVIETLWEKFEQNPEIFPTVDQIKKYVKENWEFKEYDVPLALFNLEAFDLITSREHRKGSGKYLVYEITPYGKEVMENRTGKDVNSEAVKAITITRLEFAAPNVEWYNLAREEGLVSDAYPTKAGLMFARLATEVRKRPLITKVEAKLLGRIPFTRGLFVEEELIQPYFKGEEEDARVGLQKLEAKGLVNLLPTGVVVLTQAGQYMKRALSGTPTGLATPVTPLVIRLLEAVREVGSLYVKEHKVRIKPENWKYVEKAVGVDPDTFNKILVLAREAKFILTNSLSEAGQYLLKAVDEINKKEHDWVEVLVEV
jgi:hypothetical protein